MNFIFNIPNNIIGFLKSVFKELRLVEWISLKRTIQITIGVLVVSGLTAVSLALTDKVFNSIVTNFLRSRNG